MDVLDQTTPKTINDRLLQQYGRCQYTGLQKYRLTWSKNEVEKRTGNYNVFTESGIFIRNETGTREVPKYWFFKAPCWVLERVEPNKDRQDIINHKYTYEPLFPFLDKEDKPLPLYWRPIEFLLNRLEKAEKRFLTEQDHLQIEENKMKSREEQVMGILDEPENPKFQPTFRSSSLLNDTYKLLTKQFDWRLKHV